MFVPARSLFNEVSRLVARENRLPAEDRLTECVGAVLRRWPEVGLTMAQAWLDPLQQRAGGGERGEPTAVRIDAR